MKNNTSALFTHIICIILCVLTTCLITGCSDDDDFDHDPPEGMGTLIVDNNTDNDIAVYIDGFEQEKTEDDESKAYDLVPGEYRVFLREKGGDREHSRDVDILEGRLTILDVQTASNLNRYDVFVRHD